jgi:hypothetical protein
MKVWILKRLIPDEHGNTHYHYINVFKTFEAVKEFVNAFEKEEIPEWHDCHYAMLKKCCSVRGYWEATETEVKG